MKLHSKLISKSDTFPLDFIAKANLFTKHGSPDADIKQIIERLFTLNFADQAKQDAWKKAVKTVISAAIRFKKKLDNKLSGGEIPLEDLLQVAYTKILEEIFNNDKKFNSINNIANYVGSLCKNEFYDYVNNNIYPFSVNRPDIDSKYKINEFSERFYMKNGRQPTEEEVFNSGCFSITTIKNLNAHAPLKYENITLIMDKHGSKHLYLRKPLNIANIPPADLAVLLKENQIIKESSSFYWNYNFSPEELAENLEILGLTDLKDLLQETFIVERIESLNKLTKTKLYGYLNTQEKDYLKTTLAILYKNQYRRYLSICKLQKSLIGGAASNANRDHEDYYYEAGYTPAEHLDIEAELQKQAILMQQKNILEQELAAYKYNKDLSVRKNYDIGIKIFLKIIALKHALNNSINLEDIAAELIDIDNLDIKLTGTDIAPIYVHLKHPRKPLAKISYKFFIEADRRLAKLLWENFFAETIKNKNTRHFALLFAS